MSDRACRVCGCTDQYGCPEHCHWVEPDLCSVCSGDTPRRLDHHFTVTWAEFHDAPGLDDVPLGMIGVFNPAGRPVALAWDIADAQHVARALDVVLYPPVKMIGEAINSFAAEMEVTHKPRQQWQRGPIARRPNTAIR